ncbi:hypothetical protein H7849_13490 [Alloacidobacterium dinghuense]|uniref:Uncharacterized protein n=1 Tax=Alloacidobacterium dinghuense TaxID=2763107 RepID=A0A7G8BCD5_9BACT|nr:hypothetical protein [Alloacidobacterium dinghuense]QNI30205.1 hypothetical protein H7849_13490 [Alloacidobacterium dinghuense]
MRRFSGVWLALLAFFAVPLSSALSSDPRLLSLVPPGAQIIAGMDSPAPPGRPGSFVLITRNNTIDLDDFFALTGVDSTRRVHHAVFAAIGDTRGALSEHTLMMSGHFDAAHIYKSAVDSGQQSINYRGVTLLQIQPFARELNEFTEVRWLAIPDPGLLIFGSVSSVREELDRYLANTTADAALVSRLAHLHNDDETWCVMYAPSQSDDVRKALWAFDSKLAELVGNGDEFEFGIRFRKQVEFEYEVTTASAAATHSISASLKQSLTGLGMGSSLLPDNDVTVRDKTVRSLIKIPVQRYSDWLAEVSKREHGGNS